MKKYGVLFLILVLFSGVLSSCSDDDDEFIPQLKVVSQSGGFTVMQDDTLRLSVESNLCPDANYIWTIKDEVVAHGLKFDYIAKELGDQKITVSVACSSGEVSADVAVEVYGKYKYGTFILNEGSAEKPSFLSFISPKGVITDSVYYKENNGEMLGNVSQDLFITNNKMYIVSQNGGGAGYLTITNAETLKKERSFQAELEGKVSTPTHVAVLGEDDIYLRDNKGIQLFHPLTGDVTLIRGTERATKKTMIVLDNNVYACVDKSVVKIESGKDEISNKAEFDGKVTGIVKSADKNIWVVTSVGEIAKMNAMSCEVESSNRLEGEVVSACSFAWASTSNITAKGDTLYLNGGGTKIYRHIFSANKTEQMVDASNMLENGKQSYNTVAVHPLTGEVVLNTNKGWGNGVYLNHITFFDFSGSEPGISADYKNHTVSPAGIFFTYNFE